MQQHIRANLIHFKLRWCIRVKMKKLKIFLEWQSRRQMQAWHHEIKYVLFSSFSKYTHLLSSSKNNKFHFGAKNRFKLIGSYYQSKEIKGYTVWLGRVGREEEASPSFPFCSEITSESFRQWKSISRLTVP